MDFTIIGGFETLSSKEQFIDPQPVCLQERKAAGIDKIFSVSFNRFFSRQTVAYKTRKAIIVVIVV